jgi:hypothetical protein
MTGQRYVIELEGEPAGIVVGERAGYRFYAVQSHYASLEARLFRSPGQAEHACRALADDDDAFPFAEAERIAASLRGARP